MLKAMVEDRGAEDACPKREPSGVATYMRRVALRGSVEVGSDDLSFAIRGREAPKPATQVEHAVFGA